MNGEGVGPGCDGIQQRNRADQSPSTTPPRRRKPRFQRARRSFYAIAATEGEIALPAFRPIGYLAQSRLILLAQAGDANALKQVWLQNARLAYSAANRVRLRRDLVADAVQEAQFGIVRAIQKFDVERLNEFATYAFHWVRQAVQRQRPRLTFWMRIPDHLYQPYLQFRHDFARCESRADWFDERGRWLERDPDLYQRFIQLHSRAEPAPFHPHQCTLTDDTEPIDTIIGYEVMAFLQQAMNELDDRDRFIIRRRFGLEGEPQQTLEEIAIELGITRERVRQIEGHALRQLRQSLLLLGVGRDWRDSEAPDLSEAEPDSQGQPDPTPNDDGFLVPSTPPENVLTA